MTTPTPQQACCQGFESVLPESMIINVSSDFSYSQRNGIKQILTHHKPDAIFASDDLTMILIVKVARELDIQTPSDLKVIGYDGTQFIETYTPERQPSNNPSKTLLSSWWIFYSKRSKEKK